MTHTLNLVAAVLVLVAAILVGVSGLRRNGGALYTAALISVVLAAAVETAAHLTRLP